MHEKLSVFKDNVEAGHCIVMRKRKRVQRTKQRDRGESTAVTYKFLLFPLLVPFIQFFHFLLQRLFSKIKSNMKIYR